MGKSRAGTNARKKPKPGPDTRRAHRLLENAQRAVRSRRGERKAEEALFRKLAQEASEGRDRSVAQALKLADAIPDPEEAAEVYEQITFLAEEAFEHRACALQNVDGTHTQGEVELIAVGVMSDFSGRDREALDPEVLHRAFREAGAIDDEHGLAILPWWVHENHLGRLTYADRGQILRDVLAGTATGLLDSHFESYPRSAELLGRPEAPGQAERSEIARFSLRFLVGIVMRPLPSQGWIEDVERNQRLGETLSAALNWEADRPPMTVIALDSFSEAARMAAMNYLDISCRIQLEQALEAATGRCSVDLIASNDQGDPVYLRVSDEHGVVGEIERPIAPWEDPSAVVEIVGSMLEQSGMKRAAPETQ